MLLSGVWKRSLSSRNEAGRSSERGFSPVVGVKCLASDMVFYWDFCTEYVRSSALDINLL